MRTHGLVVALTGGIGSGKSHVGRFFEELGAILLDSDHVARDVVERGTPGFDEILAKFGDSVLTSGNLDRKKLAERVFPDPALRKELEAIVHPKIRAVFDQLVGASKPGQVVINEIPLLLETNGKDRFDFVITVSAPLEIRRERTTARGMSGFEFDRRVAAQATDAERESISDLTISNLGSEAELLRTVEQIWHETLIPMARSMK